MATASPAVGGGEWEFGAVLDVGTASRALALGARDQGLGLGHSDVLARGLLGRHFSAQAAAAAHSHDGKLEAELEEAWVQTRTLPAGLQARLGRFSSQLGYLNEQHPHADDFVERPLLYRAFLGGHWFDDGLRLNWTAPAPFYLALGAEVFRGRQLVPEAARSRTPGAATLTLKTGADIGPSHSWQLGLSYLHNRREALQEEDHHDDHGDHDEAHAEDDDAHGHDEHAHDHAHGARYSGRHLWMIDAAWKWSPDGNNRQQQVKLVAELARVTRPTAQAASADRHDAVSLAAVWRLAPQWEVGVRTDRLRAAVPHDEHFHRARLTEHALMVAWKPTHAQTLRLQLTTQRNAQEFDDAVRRAVQLQYVLSFGAHGAHAF